MEGKSERKREFMRLVHGVAFGLGYGIHLFVEMSRIQEMSTTKLKVKKNK